MAFNKTKTDIQNIEKSEYVKIVDILGVIKEVIAESDLFSQSGAQIVLKKESKAEDDYPEILVRLSFILPRLLETFQSSNDGVDIAVFPEFLMKRVSGAAEEINTISVAINDNITSINKLEENYAELLRKKQSEEEILADLRTAKGKCEKLDEEITDIEKELSTLGESDWPKIKKDKESLLKKRSKDRDAIVAQRDGLASDIEAIENDITQLTVENGKLRKKVENLTTERDKIKNSVEDLQGWIELLPNQIEEWRRKYNDFSSELICLHNALNSRNIIANDNTETASIEMVHNDIEDLNKRIEKLSTGIQSDLEEYRTIYSNIIKAFE